MINDNNPDRILPLLTMNYILLLSYCATLVLTVYTNISKKNNEHFKGLTIMSGVAYRITGNFGGYLSSVVFCGQLRTTEFKIAERYVK